MSAVLLLVGISACDSSVPRGEAGGSSTVPGLHAEACSDVPVSRGTASWDWVVASEDDSLNATLGLSTTDLVTTDDGSFYIADGPSARVVVLDSLGKVRDIFGRRGAGPGEFHRPAAIAVDARRRIYVGDANGRITVLSPTGAYIRTIRIPEFVNASVTGIVPLTNGTIVVAVDARPREAREAYVRIVDSTGVTVRDVLMLPPAGTVAERPLLGHELNIVRLSMTSMPAEFAVWYPMDNFVQVFDASGNARHVFQGCITDRVRASYAAQRASGSRRQNVVILTLGVHFESPTELRMASYDWTEQAQTMRIRRYLLGQGEIAAHDYDISDPGRFYDRITFTSEGVIAFKSSAREYGIRRYVLDERPSELSAFRR